MKLAVYKPATAGDKSKRIKITKKEIKNVCKFDRQFSRQSVYIAEQ